MVLTRRFPTDSGYFKHHQIFQCCYDDSRTISSPSPLPQALTLIVCAGGGYKINKNFSLKRHQTATRDVDNCLPSHRSDLERQANGTASGCDGRQRAWQLPEQAVELGSRHHVAPTSDLSHSVPWLPSSAVGRPTPETMPIKHLAQGPALANSQKPFTFILDHPPENGTHNGRPPSDVCPVKAQ